MENTEKTTAPAIDETANELNVSATEFATAGEDKSMEVQSDTTTLASPLVLRTLDECMKLADEYNRREGKYKTENAKGYHRSTSGCNYTTATLGKKYIQLLMFIQKHPGSSRAEVFPKGQFSGACFYEMQKLGFFYKEVEDGNPRRAHYYITLAGEQLIDRARARTTQRELDELKAKGIIE